jgi:hypothetical protein
MRNESLSAPRDFDGFAILPKSSGPVSVRPRNIRILKRTGEVIFRHVAMKGYQLLVTHAEPKYASLWERMLGFERVEGRPTVVTEGHEPYIELVRRIPPVPEAITLQADPKVLFRVEGQWDQPGAFEDADG